MAVLKGTRTKKRGRPTSAQTAGRRYYDYNLLASVVLLSCFGLIMLYSTSAYEAQVKFGNDMHYFIRQGFICAACFVAMLAASLIDYHVYAKLSGLAYIVGNLLLFITKFVGIEVNGARRWLGITESLSFQPAELAKVAVILFLPTVIVKLGRNMRGIKGPAMVGFFGGFTFLLAWKFTDNLSTGLIILGITAALIFVAHPKTKPFIIGGTAGVVSVVLLARFYVSNMGTSDNFRLNRILVWMDPEKYSAKGGYQVLQGLYAIGSGGLFGKGLGNSAQKLTSLPEAQNDMIFAIICEELGLFGAALLTLLFLFLLYRLLVIAQNAPDLLGSLIVTGIFAHIAIQVVLNIAVVINLIPTTGVTLPFVSYGGTSVLFLMAEMALALSVSRQIRLREPEL